MNAEHACKRRCDKNFYMSCGNSMSASLANACMDRQKLDAILCGPCNNFVSASIPKWAQKLCPSQSI